MKHFFAAWISPEFRPTALRVALVVGSILFLVNHGSATLAGKMNRDRWVAVFLTYLVPYTVSVHGQLSAQKRSHSRFVGHEEYSHRLENDWLNFGDPH